MNFVICSAFHYFQTMYDPTNTSRWQCRFGASLGIEGMRSHLKQVCHAAWVDQFVLQHSSVHEVTRASANS